MGVLVLDLLPNDVDLALLDLGDKLGEMIARRARVARALEEGAQHSSLEEGDACIHEGLQTREEASEG